MKKKVLFIIESFALGGAERALLDIVDNIDTDKFDVSIVSLYKHSVYARYKDMINVELKPEIKCRYLVNNHVKWLYIPFNYLLNKVPSLLYRLLIGDRYDVAVAFYEGAPTYLVSKARLRRGKKMAWLQTSVALSQKNKSEDAVKAEGERYKAFYRVVALSNGVAESFVSMFPFMKEKVVVAYHPMQIGKIVSKGEESIDAGEPSRPLLLSVGRMTWAKGYDRYLRVLERLKAKGFQFTVWILGGGDRTEFEKYRDEAGLDNVRFFGNVENPYPYMRLADWLVLPSYVEGFGTVSMEAMALGTPVLATRCSGTAELLGDSEFGLVVDNGEASLEAGLEKILTDSDLKRRYESTTKERASRFDVDACLERIQEVLDV